MTQRKRPLGPLGKELLREARQIQGVQCSFKQVADRLELHCKASEKQRAAMNAREVARNQWQQERLGSIDANRHAKRKGKKSVAAPWYAGDPLPGYPKLWGRALARLTGAGLAEVCQKHFRENPEPVLTPEQQARNAEYRAKKRKLLKLK